MTHFLISDENPSGLKLEQILSEIRNDVIHRATKIMEDERNEAQHVLDNNIKILNFLNQSIALAEDSSQKLEKSFGKSSDSGPRIGN
jgi:ribosome recycling factor